jgi:hypothetical protein
MLAKVEKEVCWKTSARKIYKEAPWENSRNAEVKKKNEA